MDEATGSKSCRLCKVEKPLTEFYKLAKARDGRQAVCRPCFLERRRTQWRASPDEKSARLEALRTRPTKVCTTCGIEKPRVEFRATKQSRDGMVAWCKPCESAWHREHYQRNKAQILERSAQWYAANRERMIEVRRSYYQANKEALDEAQRRWRERNPGYFAEFMRKRRAAIAGNTVETVDLDALWTGACGICGEEIDDRPWPDPLCRSLDHIVPVARGGSHSQENLQWTHLVCNQRKGARIA